MRKQERNIWIVFGVFWLLIAIISFFFTSGIQFLAIILIAGLIATGMAALQYFGGQQGQFSCGEMIAGAVLVAAGYFMAGSPTWIGGVSALPWQMVGIDVLPPPQPQMYTVANGTIRPTNVPEGQILVMQMDNRPPVFITGTVDISSAKEVYLYLQSLRTGATSPPVLIG